MVDDYFVAVNTGGNGCLHRIRFGFIPVEVESVKLILICTSAVFRRVKADRRIICTFVRQSRNRRYFVRCGDILRRMIIKRGVGGYLCEVIQRIRQDFLFLGGSRAGAVPGLNHRHVVFSCQIKIVCSAVFCSVLIPSCNFRRRRIDESIGQILHPYIARRKLISGMGSGYCQRLSNAA